MPRISWHAQQRFALWIDATVKPIRLLNAMWHAGRDAREDEFELFATKRHPGHTYRICQYGTQVVMLVEVDGTIKTVLDQRKMKRRGKL